MTRVGGKLIFYPHFYPHQNLNVSLARWSLKDKKPSVYWAFWGIGSANWSLLEFFGIPIGGERGIRLHFAGRGLACKPNPSNPPREVRRDFASLQNNNAPHGAFEIFGGESGIRTRGRL